MAGFNMKFFSPMRIRIEKDTIVRIRRLLLGKGIINVTKGQEVVPSDIIGTALISSGYRTLKLAQMLEVSPKEIGKYLKTPIGKKIYKGELLASKSGWMFSRNKIVTSPTDGVLDFINPETGDIRLTLLSRKQDLPAGVYGIVDAVDKDRGQVIIRTQVSIVRGMFGTGGVRDGILQIISKRDELISRSFISPKLDGKILVGGSLVFRDSIISAISGGVSGIITGGINAPDYRGMAGGRLVFPKKLDNDIGISIIVCEGFGSIPIGWDIHEFLSGYDGKFVSIDGNKSIINLPSFESDSIIKVRKTSLRPFQDSNLMNYDESVSKVLEIKPGSKIRIVGNSYAGEQGKIIAMDKTETILPSGIRTFIATIETKKRRIQVPVANLEVIM